MCTLKITYHDFNNRALLKAMRKDKDYKTIAGRITRKQESPNELYNADEDTMYTE